MFSVKIGLFFVPLVFNFSCLLHGMMMSLLHLIPLIHLGLWVSSAVLKLHQGFQKSKACLLMKHVLYEAPERPSIIWPCLCLKNPRGQSMNKASIFCFSIDWFLWWMSFVIVRVMSLILYQQGKTTFKNAKLWPLCAVSLSRVYGKLQLFMLVVVEPSIIISSCYVYLVCLIANFFFKIYNFLFWEHELRMENFHLLEIKGHRSSGFQHLTLIRVSS